MANNTRVNTEPTRERSRVLHIITRLIRGGADRVVLDCIANIDHSRFEIDLMVGGQSELDRIRVPKDVERLTFMPYLVREINPMYDIPALWSMYRTIKKREYDIVHTHTAKAGFLGRLAARMARTPYVVHHLHGPTCPPSLLWTTRKFYISLERLAARWADNIVPVGYDLLDIYQQHHIGRPEQYRVIHYPLDLEPFLRARELSDGQLNEVRQSLGVRPGEIVIGKVARLEKRKGFEYYIHAAKLVTADHPNARFLIIGEGDERARLEGLVKRLDLDNQVIFTGFRKDIDKVMAALDIFGFTSLWEGLPQVMVQCAAIGRPIVAFNVEGANEIVDDGESGYIVPSRDVNMFASRISELCAAQDLRKRMASCMRDRFAPENWSLDVIAAKLDALYEEGLKDGN